MSSIRLQHKPRVIAEIGHGDKPVFQSCRTMQEERIVYVGLDIPQHFGIDMERARKEIIAARNEHLFTLVQEVSLIGELPINRGSIDEVHMHAVLDDPTIPLERRIELFQEAARILKLRGALFLGGGALDMGNPNAEEIGEAMPPSLRFVSRPEIPSVFPGEEGKQLYTRWSELRAVKGGFSEMDFRGVPELYVKQE